MKKVLTTFTVTLLSCFLIFAFVGCFQEEKELRGGFDSYGEPASPISVAFITKKSKLKIGSDLEVKLFYGSATDYNTAFGNAPASVTATLTMCSFVYEGDYQSPRLFEETVIKEIDDFSIISCDWDSEEESAAERVIIPSEWFAGKEGAISWDVKAKIVFPSDSPLKEQSEGGGISLYYIKQEEIILFNSFYDFFNYNRG